VIINSGISRHITAVHENAGIRVVIEQIIPNDAIAGAEVYA
jgi:hypothetical protein